MLRRGTCLGSNGVLILIHHGSKSQIAAEVCLTWGRCWCPRSGAAQHKSISYYLSPAVGSLLQIWCTYMMDHIGAGSRGRMGLARGLGSKPGSIGIEEVLAKPLISII